MDFLTPSRVTRSHVVVDVPGFSCFGLVTGRRSNGPIRGLVVLFYEVREHLLFVLLLPRNICLTQVRRGRPRSNPPPPGTSNAHDRTKRRVLNLRRLCVM